MRLSSLSFPASTGSLSLVAGAALTALLVVAGCTSDDTAATPSGTAGAAGTTGGGGAAGAAGSSGTPVALDQLGTAIAPVICDILKTCQGPGFGLAFSSAEACQKQIADGFADASYPTLKDEVDSGTVVFDGTKAAACLDQIKALGCDYPTSRIASVCQDLLAGQVAEGASCTSGDECTVGHYCKVDAACPGKCTPLEAAGGACKKSDDCVSGLVCDGDSSQCVKPAAIGQACKQGKPPCNLDGLCVGVDDAKKTPGMCTTYTAALSAAQGASCDIAKTQLCLPALACAVATIDATGATYSCVPRVTSGAACKLAIPSMCPTGEYCDGIDTTKGKIDGTCKALPTQGQDCAPNLAGANCAEGLVCGADLTCKARGKNGVACADKSECYGACVNKVCAPTNACTN
jgi:hypothetical protein